MVGRAELERDPERRAALLRQAARLYESEMHDPARAFAAELRAYRQVPARFGWDTLDRLAALANGWADWQSALAGSVDKLLSVDRADAWSHVAAIRDDELHQPEDSLAAVDEALAIDPAHQQALERRLGLLRRAGRWKDLAETIGRCILVEESLSRRAVLYAVLGEVYESELADEVQAAACYKLALDTDPSASAAFTALERLLRRRGELGQLVEILENRAAKAAPAESRALRRRAAEICERDLADRGLAMAKWEALRAESPTDPAPLRALARLYGGGLRSAECLEQLVELEPGDAALLAQAARTFEEQGSPDRAQPVWKRLQALEPASAEAFDALVRLAIAGGEFEQVVGLCKARAERLAGEPRAEVLTRAADVAGERLGNALQAESLFARALVVCSAGTHRAGAAPRPARRR